MSPFSILGISGGADYILLPERPPEAESWEDEMCNLIKSVSIRILGLSRVSSLFWLTLCVPYSTVKQASANPLS